MAALRLHATPALLTGPDAHHHGGRHFVHGCFWHRCPVHCHAPKANAEWWQQKFISIAVRDLDTERQLLRAGWLPVVVWEHEDMSLAADLLADLHRRRIAARRLSRAARQSAR